MRVPELAGLSEAIEPPAALAEAVEVLLAGEGEARADAAGAERHPAIHRLSHQPRPARIEERESNGRCRHLHAQVGREQADGLSIHDVEPRARPVALEHVGERGRVAAVLELDADDPFATDRHRDGGAVALTREPDGRAVSLEAGHSGGGGAAYFAEDCPAFVDGISTAARRSMTVIATVVSWSPRPAAIAACW